MGLDDVVRLEDESISCFFLFSSSHEHQIVAPGEDTAFDISEFARTGRMDASPQLAGQTSL